MKCTYTCVTLPTNQKQELIECTNTTARFNLFIFFLQNKVVSIENVLVLFHAFSYNGVYFRRLIFDPTLNHLLHCTKMNKIREKYCNWDYYRNKNGSWYFILIYCRKYFENIFTESHQNSYSRVLSITISFLWAVFDGE